MPAVSDGTAVPANRAISPEEAAARTEALFRPYHDAIAACLDRARWRRARCRCWWLSTASRRCSAASPGRGRWVSSTSTTTGWCGRSATLWRALRPGLVVGDNEPYAIVGPSDYSIPVHGQGRGLPHIEIELRQDLIGERGGVRRPGPRRLPPPSCGCARRWRRSPLRTGCRAARRARRDTRSRALLGLRHDPQIGLGAPSSRRGRPFWRPRRRPPAR